MFDVLFSIAISFAITFLAIPVIITVAEQKKLFDIPDERKVHRSPIPSLGGLGIFAGFVLACLIAIPYQIASDFQYFFAAAFADNLSPIVSIASGLGPINRRPASLTFCANSEFSERNP